jgi:hypothetical protein
MRKPDRSLLKCPNCGLPMIFAPTPDGEKNPPSFLCEDCDRLDPLTSRFASGWLQSELKPPK